ncbi:hypothetical protein [Thalassobius sp. Cn5-15]|jgi:hypothetical protein|uniref:hypothetical protein n=1 Tax=Thalassobius sp. Cn5-15 TaxID=2917763 RepID=UPI001EF3233D|nr:hypothetical protein [Thalassobius sp. Cn5-15]MCG7493909.1 hypothetical protein [Thalassobius sp. Cn5-15]
MSKKAPLPKTILTLAALALTALPQMAIAQPLSEASAQSPKCFPRTVLIEKLQSRYSEQLSGGGLQNAKQLLEVWTSPKTGSFTVFITRADGMACIMATGQNWSSMAVTNAKGVKS